MRREVAEKMKRIARVCGEPATWDELLKDLLAAGATQEEADTHIKEQRGGHEWRPNMTTDHEMRMYALNLFEILQAVDHTLTVHGKIDCGTPLHRRISDALAVPNEDHPSGQRREPMKPHPLDDESPMAHIARDIRDGIFPRRS
jgi:hypothetical protein